jgi:hypothetical protein
MGAGDPQEISAVPEAPVAPLSWSLWAPLSPSRPTRFSLAIACPWPPLILVVHGVNCAVITPTSRLVSMHKQRLVTMNKTVDPSLRHRRLLKYIVPAKKIDQAERKHSEH